MKNTHISRHLHLPFCHTFVPCSCSCSCSNSTLPHIVRLSNQHVHPVPVSRLPTLGKDLPAQPSHQPSKPNPAQPSCDVFARPVGLTLESAALRPYSVLLLHTYLPTYYLQHLQEPSHFNSDFTSRSICLRALEICRTERSVREYNYVIVLPSQLRISTKPSTPAYVNKLKINRIAGRAAFNIGGQYRIRYQEDTAVQPKCRPEIEVRVDCGKLDTLSSVLTCCLTSTFVYVQLLE